MPQPELELLVEIQVEIRPLDHSAAFAAYERTLRAYVEGNHELGRQATARRPTTTSGSPTTRR